ncbi:MAG: RDD family protein [Jaaginema sp. PMC 1079.18]|nr:RDD family protein [Jaaginema sp. PMC 1080.18]MEC4849728.1 RDD family protein [Jaaginema sp. PMC 1079.18]MEC4867697.1 RDD family protein [Jaaginema sp. PMC 1078.18]
MYDTPPKRIPKIPFDRRMYAFAIDFAIAWLLGSLPANWFAQGLIFFIVWIVSRVVAVSQNQGQSLGAWCMDMKILSLRFRRVPDLVTLARREVILGGCATLAMLGLNQIFLNAFTTLLLIAPLSADCGVAFADEDYNQAFHDRFAETIVVPTKRGFSLDLRVRRLVDELVYRVRK